jgi:NAD(P)-dependent dehydrogenase (short-subunit alcohol dehydrogenase family)
MKDVSFRLEGRVALVTGSTRGIGLAIARAFAQRGARVVVSSESATDTAQCAAALQAEDLPVLGIACDIAAPGQQRELVEETLAWGARLDVLVCNAGITGRPGPFASLDLADYDRVMAVNLRSMVELTQLALPHIARNEGGSVVLMSSISGLRGNGAINAYALAKAGVAQLARNLAVEWGPRGVRVNALSPGLIRTPLSEPLLENHEFMARRMQMTPLRRVGEVQDVAGAAVFLASPAGAFVNGHNLVVDGGTAITDGS